MTEAKTGLDRLREPFADNQIGKLPKPYKSDSPKGTCKECGGFHGLPAVHLDFVGHAALTDRLLDADPEWTWEPLALGADGLPMFDRNGGLWIRLTICGVTRLGYGDSQGKTGGNAIKEAIGDALRNGGMRFGAALDLWHKGDLHDAEVERGIEGKTAPVLAPEPPTGWVAQVRAAQTMADLTALHQGAVAGGYANPEFMAALTARKSRLPTVKTEESEEEYERRSAAEFDKGARA